MHTGRARRHELPPPRRGGVGVGVTLEKAAERAPLSGWTRLPASVQAIGRASTPRPPHPNPPPPRGREFASGVPWGREYLPAQKKRGRPEGRPPDAPGRLDRQHLQVDRLLLQHPGGLLALLLVVVEPRS